MTLRGAYLTHWEALKAADIGLGGLQGVFINVQRQAVGAAQQGGPNAQHALCAALDISPVGAVILRWPPCKTNVRHGCSPLSGW